MSTRVVAANSVQHIRNKVVQTNRRTTAAKQLASGKEVSIPTSDQLKKRLAGGRGKAAAATKRAPSLKPATKGTAAKGKANTAAPPKTDKKVTFDEKTTTLAPKKRRHRHCVTARRRVRKTLKSDELVLAKAGVHRLIHACAEIPDPSSGKPMGTMFMSRRARDSLHSVVENVIASIAAKANEFAHLLGRETVKSTDVLYVFRQWTMNKTGNFLSMFSKAMRKCSPVTYDEAHRPDFKPGSLQYDWITMMNNIGTKADVGLGVTAAANIGRSVPFE